MRRVASFGVALRVITHFSLLAFFGAARFLRQRFGWNSVQGAPRMTISVGGRLLGSADLASPGAGAVAAATAEACIMEFNKEGRDGFPFKVGFW